MGAVMIGVVLWLASAPEPNSPTHYIVKWQATGMCTVVRERPDKTRTYKIVGFTTLRRLAEKKALEFKETGKCGRVPLPGSNSLQR